MRKKRQQVPHVPVAAEIWSEDQALKARVDATAWLRCVASDDIARMIAGDWSGRGTGTPLIRFYGARDEEVAILLNYAGEAGTELCFRIDRAAALTWLDAHRPTVAGDFARKPAPPGSPRAGAIAPIPGRGWANHPAAASRDRNRQ